MKRITISVLAALLAALLLAACEQSHEPSRDISFLWQQHPNPYSEAAALAAAAEAQNLLDSDPDNLQLHYYLQDRLRGVRSDSLSQLYQERLAADDDDAYAILLEARATGGRSHTAEAAEKALAIAPDDPYVLAFAARAFAQNRPPDTKRALQLAQKAVESAPNLPQAQLALAEVQLASEDFEAALAAAERAAELAPNDFEAVYLRTSALDRLERGEESLAVLEDFQGAHPIHPYALYFLERRYRASGELAKLEQAKRAATEANPEEGWAWLEMAGFYEEIGKPDSIYAALHRAVDAGFFDHHLVAEQLDESVTGDPRFVAILEKMKQQQKQTRDERRAEAVAEMLDVEAPAIEATTPAGEQVSLADLRGKVVVLDFWATWCGPCKMTIPRLRELSPELGRQATLVSVNVWERMSSEERPGAVAEFAREEGMEWPVWLAPNEAAEAYEVSGIPTFVVIDPEGVIRYKFSGYRPFLDETLKWMVEAARSGEQVALAR